MKLTTLDKIASKHPGSVVYGLVSQRSGGRASLRVVGDEGTLKNRLVQVGIHRHQRHTRGYKICGTGSFESGGDLVFLWGHQFTVGKRNSLVVTPLQQPLSEGDVPLHEIH